MCVTCAGNSARRGSAHDSNANDAGAGETPVRFAWREDSTYIRRPAYWQAQYTQLGSFRGLRALAVLGDNITTDHLSPSGAILPDSAAGEFLMSKGVTPAEFNSYGTRRGVEGSLARLEPEGKVMRLFEAIARPAARRCTPRMWTCWRASSRWASCTTR